jgi:DHA2 family multidrug resistance protein
MTLLPPMLQGLMGYSVLESGLVFMPRGMGTFISMLIVGNLVGRVDTRLLMVIALGVSSVGVWMMTQYDLSMGKELIVVSTFLQGVGIGLYFSPLTALAFATIAPHLRGEASSFFALIRSMGSSVGISIMQALMVSNTQVAHSSLAARIIPEDPAVAADLAGRFDLSTVTGLEALNGEITRQAAMIAILNDYRLMLWLALASLPIVFLLRPPKHVDKSELPVMHE